jgi:hypothetical protein
MELNPRALRQYLTSENACKEQHEYDACVLFVHVTLFLSHLGFGLDHENQRRQAMMLLLTEQYAEKNQCLHEK